ncbi:MAG TPA: SRPBCC family protein [Gaiellaceae bacterium]|nr:SRPBCC family protein [Gaiellaceae bacterium]
MTTMTAQGTQVYSVFIRATPEQVWDAITKPEFTQQYFYGARIEVRDGRRFSAIGENEWDEAVLEEDPPRRLVHGWISAYDEEMGAEEPSRVTWEIEPQDGGVTKLTVVHDRLEGAPKTAESVAGGWMYVLSGLKTLLETGRPLAA